MYSYEALSTSFIVLLSACAALAVIWGAVKAFKEIRNPHDDLVLKVEEHDRKLVNDHERLEDLKESNDLQALMLLQMANHMIDGNHTDLLIEARDNLQKYLVKR